MRLRPLLLSAALAMFAMVSPAYSADPQGEASVQVIKGFLKDVRAAMASRDPAKVRAVAERYMDADYVQHSSGYPPGREGFIKGVSSAFAGGPPAGAPPAGSAPPAGAPPAGAPPAGLPSGAPSIPKDLYFIGDGEYVVWVSEGKEPGKLMFNMVRVVNGKMKEHWDSI